MRKKLHSLLCAGIAAATTSVYAADIGACTSSHPFSLDINSSTRMADVRECLTYDSTWYGGSSSAVKFRINDAEFAEVTGIGDRVWEPHRPGTYTITATTYQNGSIVGDVLTAEFEVIGRDLVNATVSLPDGMPLYDGTPRTPRVAVVYQGETLVEGQDYTVFYENNISGVGKAIITGMGRFHDEVEQTFKIMPAGICSLDICSGTRIADFPEKLTYDENWFSSTGAGYVRIMENGVKVAQENGRGEYEWSSGERGVHTFLHRTYIDGYLQDQVYTAKFLVGGGALSQSGIEVTLSPTAFKYDGTPKVPTVTVSFDGENLRQNIDYTVSCENNVDVGTANVIVTGIGEFNGEIRKPFTIYGDMGARVLDVKQRYPWNGLVDIDCLADGEPGRAYRTTFSALDVIGGTNLPMKTVWREGASAINRTQEVMPGRIRFVWDANTDLPDGTNLDQVKIVTSSAKIWQHEIGLSVNGYTGSSTLSRVPVLVRLKSGTGGFAYSDMASPETGKDLRFVSNDDATVYPHEIDTWNMNGDSLVWVRLPSVAKTGTTFKMQYGNPLAGTANTQAVWSDYVGVWHMGSSENVAKDSTSHGLDATPNGTTMTVFASGACGLAQGNTLAVPNYDSLSVGQTFTASGWFRSPSNITTYPKPFYRNDSGWNNGGWGVEFSKSATAISVVGSSNSSYLKGVAVPTVLNKWVYFTFVYNGTTATCYTNGVSCKSGTIVAAVDNGKTLKIGVSGLQSDEVRLRKGTVAADRIKADYAVVANKNFLKFGTALTTSPVSYESGVFRLRVKHDGIRQAVGDERLTYSSAWATNALTGANAVVKVWPVKREKPKYIAIDLSGGTAATHYPIEYLEDVPDGGWSDEYKTSKLVLRHISAGSFIMGGRATDYPGAVNTNLHMVTLTKDFYMGVFEVTQRQWELVMGNRPSAFSNETCYAARPVEMVSYIDIRGGVKGVTWPNGEDVDEDSFMGVLRRKVGLSAFDLPTEAQWEYACRAGTTTALNSGKNISDISDTQLIQEANEVARYHFNSGAPSSNPVDFMFGEASDKGTAIVGEYLPNAWGLYDMHGNLYELCLDFLSAFHESGVDPVGPVTGQFRSTRGGSWYSGGYAYSSSYWGASIGEDGCRAAIGFRLCLQGGELPELESGTVLVNEAGEGAANWTPTKAGTYYLTHETQTNGVNVAEVLGAWFKVDAPELTFTPDGDLVPGVNVSIGGAGEGWTVRYEVSSGGQGAARPTGASPEYTGPITLNDSQTIRAIAFSDGGLESREFSATYSLMSIGSAVAKPRYPWNGKVDIDCEVKGDANRQYLVSLEAIDLDGGTNLPVRMVVGRGAPTAPQSQASEFDFGGRGATALPPGTYRFTWDADADIAGDFDFANVAVKVSAEGSSIIAAKKVLPLEVAGYTGTETLTNVPVLVRLSTAISGFSYADFADANGGDMVFCDEGASVIYPHEIDEWHVGGESLVWVKLPTMANGTKFKMVYGNSQLTTHNSQLSPHEVWRDYAGVWHMNEDSGTAFDSTTHGLDAFPEKWTNRVVVGSTAMMAYENGACGRARQNETIETSNAVCGNYLLVPSYDALALGSKFSVSAWFRADQVVNFPRMIARKNTTSEQGWEIHPRQSSTTNISLRGSASNHMIFDIPDMLRTWVSITAVFDGSTFSCYTNGVQSIGMPAANGETTAAVDNGLGLGFGSIPRGQGNGWCGQYDEIRLRGGSLSADRIKADYDMINNHNFLSYGSVENGKGAAE